MNKDIIITADSTCDLSDEIIEKYQIKIIPLHIIMGDTTYSDGVDLTAPQIFDYVAKTGQLPQTAAVSILEYAEFFRSLLQNGNKIIHVSIGAKFSSTHQNACLAAQEVDPDNIWVVDSENLSTGSGHVVMELADLLEAGASPAEAVEKIKEIIPKVNASFILGNLEYMKKGGRCTAVVALGANILKLRACIEVKNGEMALGKKYRGQLLDVLKKYTDDVLSLDKDSYVTKRVFVTSTCTEPDLPEAIKKYVEQKQIFDEVIITTAGSTVTSHCGKDTLGVLFITK